MPLNFRSRGQRSRSHLCHSGDWITQPLHQECYHKHSNIPPRHSSSNCQEIIASGSKNIHQLFSNYPQCLYSPSMVLFSTHVHPLNKYVLSLFICFSIYLFAYLFIYLFVCFPFPHLFSCCVVLLLPSPLLVTYYIGSF